MATAAPAHICRGCALPFSKLATHLKRKAECKAAYAHDDRGEQPVDVCPVLLDHVQRERRELVSNGLGELRFEKGHNDSTIQPIKTYVNAWNDAAKSNAVSDIMSLGKPTADAVADILSRNYNHFEGLRTEKQELAYLRETVPTVPVVERDVGMGHVVCDIPLLDNIERFLKHAPEALVDKIEDASERMKSGMYRDGKTSVIEDFYHGSLFREHEASAPSTDPDEWRVILGGYTDGCEMANGMGPSAGDHALWCSSVCRAHSQPAPPPQVNMSCGARACLFSTSPRTSDSIMRTSCS